MATKKVEKVKDSKTDELVKLAQSVFDTEKNLRRGDVSNDLKSAAHPVLSFLVKDEKVLMVPPPPWREEWRNIKIGDSDLGEKDIYALWLRLAAHIFNIEAYISVVEAYSLNCCGTCGSKNIQKEKEPICLDCGANMMSVMPMQSKFSTEILGATLQIKDDKNSRMWMSNIIRDKYNRIIDYVDISSGEDSQDMQGRFANIWSIDEWMTPHFIANYPVLCKGFGVKPDKEIDKLVKIMNKFKPADYKLIMFPVADVIGIADDYLLINGKKFSKEQAERISGIEKISQDFRNN